MPGVEVAYVNPMWVIVFCFQTNSFFVSKYGFGNIAAFLKKILQLSQAWIKYVSTIQTVTTCQNIRRMSWYEFEFLIDKVLNTVFLSRFFFVCDFSKC